MDGEESHLGHCLVHEDKEFLLENQKQEEQMKVDFNVFIAFIAET